MYYFWCESGEDGTRIDVLTEAQAKHRLKEVADGERSATFLGGVPDADKGCWNAPEDAVVIVKGDIVVPKAKSRVTEFSL